MNSKFQFDVFLSHSSKDIDVVRIIAEKLRSDGLRVWLDLWEIHPGDNIPAKIEEGLERSRVLVLCMSANAFGSDWAKLESYTFRFRDPLNKERRFLPLHLDNTPIKGSLSQFLYIKWLPKDRDREYSRLLEACRAPLITSTEEQDNNRDHFEDNVISFGHASYVRSVAWSPDGSRILSGSCDCTMLLWDVESGKCLRVFEGHSDDIFSVAWSFDGSRALSGSVDRTIRLWDVETGKCLRVFENHSKSVRSVAWGPDGRHALSGSVDKTVLLWDVESGKCLREFKGHTDSVYSVSWSPDGRRVLSGSGDYTMRLWNVKLSNTCLRVFKGHTDSVRSVAWGSDGRHALSGSVDKTVLLWDVETGQCLRVFKGHTESIYSVAWGPDGRHALSGSVDKTIRLWDLETGQCLRVFEGHTGSVMSVAWGTDSCRSLSGSVDKTIRLWDLETGQCLREFKGHTDSIYSVAWSPDGHRVLCASESAVNLWDMETGKCLRSFKDHTDSIYSVAWSPDGCYALFGSKTALLWDMESGKCLRMFEGHTDDAFELEYRPDGSYYVKGSAMSVAWSPDGCRVLSSFGSAVHLLDMESGKCLCVFEGHTGSVMSVAWSPNGRRALSGSVDKTVRLWDVETGKCLRIFEGHYNKVYSVAWSPDDCYVLSGSLDNTIRLWNVRSNKCLRVFEGHSSSVICVAWSPDGRHALSGSDDNTVRLWNVESGQCLCVFKGHSKSIICVAWSPDGDRAFSVSVNGVIRVWKIAQFVTDALLSDSKAMKSTTTEKQVQYTNAKVLLVGDSGVGKTGLANRLALKKFEETLSTDGAWATHWPLPHVNKKDQVDREIWLWDFAGQVDYRLVHQLFMDNTAVAVLVFNPQHENPFEGLGHWDRDIQKAARKTFAKILVAGRIDRGGLLVSDVKMEKFIAERGFIAPMHLTSAKTKIGCDKLREAIVQAIDWKSIPKTTSSALYHQMKQEILHLRDNGLVLIRMAELKQRMAMTRNVENFKLEELEAVVSLLSGPGMIQRLDFGGFILLQPEVLSRYAAAVVRKVRKHPNEMGCIREDELLAGNLDYQDFKRLPQEDEAVVLRTLLETFVSRAWCLRQPCDGTALLTFPSYFRRERKEQPGHPNVLVTYRFDGPIDDIYATLVVRLHYTVAFQSTELWRSAADFKTKTGATLGFTLTRESEGNSRLEIYFEPDVDANSRVLFLRYVHDHLLQYAKNVIRLRHYGCENKKCDAFNQPFMDHAKIDKALASGGKGKIFCPDCGKPISLRDAIEEEFESPVVKQQVRKLQMEGQTVIDNESRELILVGHAFSIVAEAGQIYRSYTNSDHGIDGEIEFKDDEGCASGKRLYIQLKSGDSHLIKRKQDDMEIFHIKNPRWVDYWQQQAYPMMLVIRTSNGEIRWMDVSAYLKRERDRKRVTQILFEGERFDVMSVRRWRDKMLSDISP